MTLTGDEVIKPTEASATQEYISKVIKKSVVYDYSTKRATWTIVVNQNDMNVNNAILKDEIASYMKFIGEVKVNGAYATLGATADQKGSYYFDKNTKLFTYNFPNSIVDEQTVAFVTEIDKPLEFFKDNGNKNISNTAKLYGNEIADNVSHTATKSIENQVVNKDGVLKKNEYKINWSVIVNQNKVDIKGPVLEDILPEGLVLDTSSVELYKMKTESDGTLTVDGAKIPLTNDNIKYDANTRKFEFDFNKDITDAYKLTFTTDIEVEFGKTKSYTNTIKFKGTGVDEDHTATGIAVTYTQSEGEAWGSSRGSVTLVKVDKDESGKKLSGAIFELLDENNNVIKISSPTNSEGNTLFRGLHYGRTYYVREKTEPTGYVLSNEKYEFTVKNESGKKDITYDFNNTKIKGNIEFTKKGEGDNKDKLPGAEFKIYKESDTTFSNPIETATSDANGLVKFDNIEYGKYVIRETVTPEGYLTHANIVVEIKENNKTLKLADVVNIRIKGNIEFDKVDEFENPLQGANFGLYKALSEDFSTPIKTKMSDSNGKVLFEDVPYGQYKIREITAPNSYAPSTDLIEVSIIENGATVIPRNTPIINKKVVGDVEVIKFGETEDIVLEGAKFALMQDDIKYEGTTDSQGRHIFNDVVFGTYILKEITPPKGYNLSNKTQEVKIESQGQAPIRVEFKNNKIRGSIKLQKLDENDNGLKGAEFGIFKLSDTKFKTPIKTELSNSEGYVVFTGVEFGDYNIKETKAAEGYNLSDKVIKNVSITTEGIEVIPVDNVIKNTKIRGNLEITKVRRYTDNVLRGAKISLYTKDDVFIEEKETGTDGKVVFENLEYGDYYFVETKAPAGYLLDTVKNPIEIRENGEIVKVKFENRPTCNSYTTSSTNYSRTRYAGNCGC